MWTTTDVEHWLFDLVSDNDEVTSARSFAAAGLMTRDRGLVLRFASGLEVQLTIVRSANPTEPEDDESDGNADAEAVADAYRHALRQTR